MAFIHLLSVFFITYKWSNVFASSNCWSNGAQGRRQIVFSPSWPSTKSVDTSKTLILTLFSRWAKCRVKQDMESTRICLEFFLCLFIYVCYFWFNAHSTCLTTTLTEASCVSYPFCCFSFFMAANVHFLCTKLQVHISQCIAHDQLYAADSNRDVLSGHTSNIQASLHLHSTDGHPPQERHDHEEKGWFLNACVCSGRCSAFESFGRDAHKHTQTSFIQLCTPLTPQMAWRGRGWTGFVKGAIGCFPDDKNPGVWKWFWLGFYSSIKRDVNM